MQIVFIGPFGLQPKGTMSVRALPLAKALAARGHQVTVLIPPWDDPGRSGQNWTDGGITVVNVELPPPGLRRWPGLFQLGLTQTLVKQALARQPDVIHLFKPKAYAGLAHLVLRWLRRWRRLSVKLVVDADDWEQAWNELLPYSIVQKKFFAWQETWGLSHADAVTVASRALAELVVTRGRGEATRVFYAPNGIDATPVSGRCRCGGSSSISEVALPFTRNTYPTILLFSRFAEFRLERVVTLIRLVANDMPEARWLVVGRGFRSEEQRLAALVTAAGFEAQVHFVAGWVPPEQVAVYFAAADVAVYPYDDTLLNRTKCSVKLIDMLAAGLPVVADAVGQNCEYIQPGETGLLTPAEDDEAMAQAVIKLLQSPELRQHLGQAAARALRQKFTWSRLAEIVEKAYV